MGIEPTSPAWKAGALPLCYARIECAAKLHQQSVERQEQAPLAVDNEGHAKPYCTRHGAITASGIPWRIFLSAGQTVARMPPSFASSPTTK
jgi:hypothetical protein